MVLSSQCLPARELEQLERLRSEDTPCRLMITHTIESYWIPSQKKTKSKLQILKIRQNFKFLNFEMGITRDTPSEVAWWDVEIWNRSDEYCWRYRADTILSKDGQTDRRSDGQGDTSIPPFQLRWRGGIITLEIRWFFIGLIFTMLTRIGNAIVEIRWSYDHLISTMGFPLLVWWHLYIGTGPWMQMNQGWF